MMALALLYPDLTQGGLQKFKCKFLLMRIHIPQRQSLALCLWNKMPTGSLWYCVIHLHLLCAPSGKARARSRSAAAVRPVAARLLFGQRRDRDRCYQNPTQKKGGKVLLSFASY